MGKIRQWIVLLSMLLLLGCGARAAIPPAPLPFVPGSPTPPAVREGAGVTVLAPFVNQDERAFREVLAEFSATSGIPVEYEGATEVAATLLARLEANEPPDVVLLPKPNWLGELASAGVLAPLDEAAAEAVRRDYTEGWQRLVSYNEELYGVPFRATSKSLVWYRVAALAEAGGPPETWEAWLALNGALAAAGERPLAVPGGVGWPLTDWFENIHLRLAGPEHYQRLIRHEVAWTDPAVRESFEALGSLLREEWLAGGRTGTVRAPLAETVTGTLRLDGPEAAMLLGAGWVGPFVATNSPGVVLGRDVDFFPFPDGDPRYAGAVVGAADLAVALSQRDEAQALLRFLASPAAARVWAEQGGFVAPNRALDPDSYPDPQTRREAAQLAEATIFVPDLSDTVPAGLSAALTEGLQRYLVDPTTLDDILRSIEAAARRTQG